jgi:hypothetical protein
MQLCDYCGEREGKFHFKNGKWCCENNWHKCPTIRNETSLILKNKKAPIVLENNKIILCSYGCNQLAKYYFEASDKYCCDSHYKKCPIERNKCLVRTKGDKNPMFGKTHTEESKTKIIKSLTGKKHSEESKLKRSKKMKAIRKKKYWTNKNGPLSEETKIKISKANKGRKCSEQFCKECSVRNKGKGNPMYGKHHSEKTKQLIRENSINNFKSKEFLKKWTKSINRKMNKPEEKLNNILQSILEGYEYVGDYKIWIGGKNPDFINEKKKKIIEFFGDYWHDEEFTKESNVIHDKNRINHFNKYDYSSLIIRQQDLEDKEYCIKKIMEFDNEKLFSDEE